jgi:UDP-N-acetyl-D-mannosaminuronate dehydrogenase
MGENHQSLKQITLNLFKKCLEYSEVSEIKEVAKLRLPRVLFLGLNLHPNKDGIWNFDILHIYKAFQQLGIDVRIHDPHMHEKTAISMGVWLGRRFDEERWSQGFDVLILSTPHVFYIQNIIKLSALFRKGKSCMFLDLFGAFSKLSSIGNDIDIVNYSTEYEKGDILGGLPNMLTRH